MNRFCKPATTASIAFTMGALLLLPMARAQTPPATNVASPQPKEDDPDKGLHVGITPYIWFAGMHGSTGVLGRNASVHASFGDIFSYLNIGLMGAAEVRYNRVVMPVDFMWMKLSDDKGLPLNQVGVQSIKAKVTETLLTPKIGYRVVSQKRVNVDALFGIRYWHLTTDFTLQPTQVAGGFSRTADWVDAVAGGKIEMALTPKVVLTILGDAGGGSAKSDYQVAGLMGYKISRRWVLLAGYRYLSVNYRPNSRDAFVYDVIMPGVALGATFNIK
jgi:hypothetical protein